MKDVADRAGVTIGTVSHVINHTASISEETTRRVRKAIEELNYVPNNIARNMRAKTNNRVGLMIPNLTNNFHASIASLFVDLADQNNYVVHIMGYEYSVDREKDELRSLMEYNVGTIVIVNGFGDEKFIDELLDRGIQMLSFLFIYNIGVNTVRFNAVFAGKGSARRAQNKEKLVFICSAEPPFRIYRKTNLSGFGPCLSTQG